MRFPTKIGSVVPLLLLPLISSCLEPEHLSTRGPTQALALEETADPRGMHYASRRAAPGQAEIFSLIIEDKFSLADRAKILRAVSEWNVALNGFIRFEIMPAGGGLGAPAHEYWVITPRKGPPGVGSSIVLAAVYASPGIGGVMALYLDRIGRRDLGAVVMHELGHVLGLDHSSRGSLMAAHYHPTSQRCIDKATIEALAAKRGLSPARLNWCEKA